MHFVNLLFFRCKLSHLCSPYSYYQLINPTTQNIIQSVCSSACEDIQDLYYRYKVWNGVFLSNGDLRWVLADQSQFYG